jgi:hypothetical protein
MSKVLIWVGAGSATSPKLDVSNYNKVILVDPLLSSTFTEKLGDTDKFVTLHKGVVASSFKPQAFHIFNNDEFSSFLEPTGLKKYFPNLAVDEIRDVEVMTILDIAREYNLTGEDNTLMLELPCLSGDILQEVSANGALHLFNTVIVSAGKESLYKNGSDIKTVTELLNNEYYEFIEELSDDIDISTQKFRFNPSLKQIAVLKNKGLDLEAQLKLVVNTNLQAESDKEQLKSLLANSQVAFGEVQAELQVVTEKAHSYEHQNNALGNEKEALESQLLNAGKKAEEQSAVIDQLKNELQAEKQKSQQLDQNIDRLTVSEEAGSKKITSLASELKSANERADTTAHQVDALKLEKETLELQLAESNKKTEEQKIAIEQKESQLQAEQKKLLQLQADIDRLKVSEEASSKKITSLKTELQTASDYSAQKIEKLSVENERLTSELDAEKERAYEAYAAYENLMESEKAVQVALTQFELQYKSSVETHAKEINALQAQLKEGEDKQKETYGWFASRKQQAEDLTVEIEALKRENALLIANNETASAVSKLEQKLTAMLNKQNDDSIEIANALGKHVTRCYEEQKSNIVSQFELRKLSALSRLSISSGAHSMDTVNLAELSSLISLNNYDVIIEFGSGLSTVVAASALLDKAGQISNNDKYLQDKSRASDIENSLPKHIISFEQSSEFLQKTSVLLAKAGVEAYVDLCHAPMVSVPSFDNSTSSNLFYDCTEKLLELKRIISSRNVKILVIVDGPEQRNVDDESKFWALPLALDYFSQSSLTFLLNNSLSDNSGLPLRWKDECTRRNISVSTEQLATPKGITILNLQS